MLKGKGRLKPEFLSGLLLLQRFWKESPAKEAGVKAGDELIAIDSIKFTFYDEFQKYLEG